MVTHTHTREREKENEEGSSHRANGLVLSGHWPFRS